jgi:hypothetical protein
MLSQRSSVRGRRHANGPPERAREARFRGKLAIKRNLAERRAPRRDHDFRPFQPARCAGAIGPTPLTEDNAFRPPPISIVNARVGYRSDRSRHTKGLGLGLSLVVAIVKLHGFRLTIHPRPGFSQK